MHTAPLNPIASRLLIVTTLLATLLLGALLAVTPTKATLTSTTMLAAPVLPQISAGDIHTCFIDVLGRLACWGSSENGRLMIPSDLGSVTQVTVGGSTCAITHEGLLRCWGSSHDYVSEPNNLGNVGQVSMGSHHTCAVLVTGELRCWGDNWDGEVNIPSDLGSVSQVSVNEGHTCAVTISGAVHCWGRNSYGETNVPADLGSVTQVRTGLQHTCALTTEGVVRCWGWNVFGQATAPADLTNAVQISAGLNHSCAVTASGNLRCWGDNTYQQATAPPDLGLIKQVSAGHEYTCVVTSSDTARCWGLNAYGQATVPSDPFAPTPTPTPVPTPEVKITLASVSSNGVQANGESSSVAMSADGRYIAFDSRANNLVPGDPGYVENRSIDIFVRDRLTGLTSVASINSAGEWANERSFNPSISADGRYVAFESWASNLVDDDTNVDENGNSHTDIFVHDRQTGATARVSVASDGTQANESSYEAQISGDGRYVAFISFATNLVSNDTNDLHDVFVHDRQTGATTRVSVASDGTQANVACGSPAISGDGRYIAFTAYGDGNLVPEDTNESSDVFVHDRLTGATTRVSVQADGSQTFYGSNDYPALSADGRYIAFDSTARITANDTNNDRDVFVRDQLTGTVSLVSVNSRGVQSRGDSGGPTLSADGRYVGFDSYANLTEHTLNMGSPNGYMHDRLTGKTILVSVTPDGAQGDGFSGVDAISTNGSWIAFSSWADNLIPDDKLTTPGNEADVYIAEVIGVFPSTATLASNHPDGAPGSSFLINAAGFPAGASVELSINGITVGAPLTVGSDGGIRALLQTVAGAAPGRYRVVLRVVAGPTALHPTNSTSEATTSYRLAADAPMREPPTGVEAPAVTVPTSIAAGPEGVFLPLVRR
ncbi:PD40 domain-containing protein [Candidatus Chloroploca sp. Khr17]|uniref:PD40 domain-containing protein n=1 Tax=Candidatus Chloroploca sp. Khr17 TaxID=2496869 RepID=UPI0013EA54C8|nr:PD40 domain-containing protein [Candidatus Chloroploca sp. Khr17]